MLPWKWSLRGLEYPKIIVPLHPVGVYLKSTPFCRLTLGKKNASPFFTSHILNKLCFPCNVKLAQIAWNNNYLAGRRGQGKGLTWRLSQIQTFKQVWVKFVAWEMTVSLTAGPWTKGFKITIWRTLLTGYRPKTTSSHPCQCPGPKVTVFNSIIFTSI